MQQQTAAERIKARRQALGLTQARLAKAAGISRTGLIFIETGRRQPKPETVDKLEKALFRAESQILYPRIQPGGSPRAA